MRTTLSMIVAITISIVAWAAAPPSLRTDRVKESIRQLASDDYEVRNAAYRRLIQLDPPEEVLREASKDADADLTRQLRSLIATLARGRLQRIAERLKADARAMNADLFAERFFFWQGADDETACWQEALNLAWNLIEYERRTFGRLPTKDNELSGVPPRALDRYFHRPNSILRILPRGKPQLTAPKGGPIQCLAGRGEQISLPKLDLASSLLICSGPADLHLFNSSFVVAGGDVTVTSSQNAVILCGGNCDIVGTASNSVIVARGTVKGPGTAIRSVILAGKSVTLPESSVLKKCDIHSGGAISRPKPFIFEDTKLVEHKKDATRFVRFFEPAHCGVEVMHSETGVRIDKVENRTPFARAGCRPGDRIDTLAGVPVESSDAFRRLLRKHVAVGGEVELRVRRDGKPHTLHIQFD